MRRPAPGSPTRIVGFALLFVALVGGPLAAADHAVVLSGSWSSTSTWSGGVVPGVNDNAFVGSTTPGNALKTATVTLTQDVTAGNVYLGHDSDTSGTLELGNFTFTANTLFFGFNGAGLVTRGTGHLDLDFFDIRNGNTFTLAASDLVHRSIDLAEASSLTLSANLAVTDDIDLRDNDTVFNANSFEVQANQILVGWNSTGALLQNYSKLTANHLLVRAQDFQLTATDAVGRFALRDGDTNLGAGVVINRLDLSEGATAITSETGNITGFVLLEAGTTLTLGADLSLSDKIDIRGNGTILNAQGHDISATNEILLGWSGSGTPTLQNPGKITTGSLQVRNQDFQLAAADAVGRFWLSAGDTNLGAGVVINRLDLSNGATATTSETGNITGFVQVESGSTLTLNANLALNDKLNLRGSGTILNAQGHDISATNAIAIGWDDVGPTLQNPGKLTTNELLVRGQNFQLKPTDTVAIFRMNNGTTNLGAGVTVQHLHLASSAVGTTAETGNITKSVLVESGSTLTLGANLTLTENLNLRGGGVTLNASGRDISTTGQILLGWESSGTPVLQNVGTLTAGELLQRNGTQLLLGSGADASGRIFLFGNSRLTASVSAGGTGLTLTRSEANELNIETGSHLTLALDGNQAGWVFRWANPTGGDHIADLNTLISQGKIDFTFQNNAGFAIASNADGYTYVTMVPVPEPASVVGLCAATAGLVMGVKRRGKGSRAAHTST
jgi:hypothetical protein